MKPISEPTASYRLLIRVRDASPTAAIIDSQSAKTTEAGGPRGYDAGKKINGRKRHALVDTDGRGQGYVDCGRDRAHRRRRVVERFFAWIGRNRRLAKDFEASIDSARAFLYAASIMLLVRRIART
jgi:hypothetical protein